MTNPMTNPTANTLAWFEVGTADPDAAVAFYADLFGWTFTPFADPEEIGIDYRVATSSAGGPPFGGITGASERLGPHAIFTIAVADVAATCRATEALGGTVVVEDVTPKAGPPNAYLRDPQGNLFGIFTPLS